MKKQHIKKNLLIW